MATAPELLAQIPDLLQSRDAAALVGLEEHTDRQVRKAARRALHLLRAKGVEIPAAPRSWSPEPASALRGDLQETAMVDVGSTPGLTRVYVAKPGDERRGQLMIATVTAFDQVVDFKVFAQTDGQRARMLRDWERLGKGRGVPVEWAKARIRWGREETLRLGVPVPQDLNDALIDLGSAPTERPAPFMADTLGAVELDSTGAIDGLLQGIRANFWPPLVDVEPFLKRVTEAHPDLTQESPIEEREGALRESVVGDPAVQKALRGPLANLFDDAVVGLWLAGNDDLAAQAWAATRALREAEAPETLPWVVRILGLQIASTLAYQQNRNQAS